MSSFQNELEGLARREGADFFGVADLTVAHDDICSQGGESLKMYTKAISIGVRLSEAVIGELFRHEDPAVIYAYRGLWDMVNSRLDQIALSLGKRIQERGYKAAPIPAAQTIDESKLTGVISHKLPASLAGVGWIGKSCLLITPQHGPRVRFSTVLTDARLKTGSKINDKCDECRACIEICPVKAFTGNTFTPSEPREYMFNAQLCHEYMKDRKRKLGDGLCGLCVYICPYGRARYGRSGV